MPLIQVRHPVAVVLGMTLLLAVSAAFCLTIGPMELTNSDLFRVIFGGEDGGSVDRIARMIVWDVRLPRIVLAVMLGAALAVSGAAMQGVFANPLAEPGVMGVTAGGALGGVLAMHFGWNLLSPLLLPVSAFAGALLATAIVYTIATEKGRASTVVLLLAGLAVATLCNAGVSYVLTQSVSDVLRQMLYWLMGGLEGHDWSDVRLALPFILLGIAGMMSLRRELDILVTGEDAARSVGVNPSAVRSRLGLYVALASGAAVSVGGNIAFVGLVVPHILRLLFGPRHRTLIPASVLGGAIFLLWSDALARTVSAPEELRLGFLTSLLGAPLFLALLFSQRRKAGQ